MLFVISNPGTSSIRRSRLLISLTLSCSLLVGTATQAQKQTIDTETLSTIILEKQEELKTRLLSDLVVKHVSTTNYTTYNTLYYLVNTLVAEKNKTVMTQEIVRNIARYTVSHVGARYVVEQMFGDADSLEYEVPELSLIKMQKNGHQKYLVGLYKEGAKPTIEQAVGLFYSMAIDSVYIQFCRSDLMNRLGLFDQKVEERFITYGLEADYEVLIKNNPIHYAKFSDELKKFREVLESGDQLAGIVEDNDYSARLRDLIKLVSKYNFSKFPKSDTGRAFTISQSALGSILQSFETVMSFYKENIGEGTLIAKISELIVKYVVFDDTDSSNSYDYKIDVEGIILALEDEFLNYSIVDIRQHWIGVKPFFTIGLNYAYFIDGYDVTLDDGTTKTLEQLTLANERMGVKFIVADFKYTRSQKPNEWFQYRGVSYYWDGAPRPCVINNIYGFVYVSGILYNIVNLKSDENFTNPLLGAGIGVEFFNGLELNASYGQPVDVGSSSPFSSKNGYISIGFDIPIFEYIKAAKK